MELAPVKLKPIFKHRIWGSELFKTIFHLDSTDESIGECWQLVDTLKDQSIIDGGKFDCKTLRWFLTEYGETFGFTQEQCQSYFGLLGKYLDASDVLSVQVHPDADICKKYGFTGPKVKCWYVVDAKDDAYIYVGMIDGVIKDDMRDALKAGNVENLLFKKKAQKGDFFYIPAGTLHALGAGILVAEIGTPSKAAFRLYDWDRKDTDGMHRELNVEESMESIYFEDSVIHEDSQPSFLSQGPLQTVAEALGEARMLVECPYFSVAEVKSEAQTREFKSVVPFFIVPISGSASISNEMRPDDVVEIEFGAGIIFPATQHGIIEFHEDTTMLICSLGPIKMSDNINE